MEFDFECQCVKIWLLNKTRENIMRTIERKRPFFIISAELSTLSGDENAARSEDLELDIQRLVEHDYKLVDGVYKGSKEQSYVVFCDEDTTLDTPLTLGKKYGQESILIVDSDRNSTLVFCNTLEGQCSGTFKAVSKYEAEASESYTYDHVLDMYFICK